MHRGLTGLYNAEYRIDLRCQWVGLHLSRHWISVRTVAIGKNSRQPFDGNGWSP